MDTSQLLKGVLPMAALSVISTGDAYGYEVLHELRSAGLGTVGDASVYGTLQRAYDAGLLSSYLVASESGPSRRYYSLTPTGQVALKDARATWDVFRDVVTGLLDRGATP
jgi:PadR family transcriptional regulator PadR